jgi:hypothetical protein
MLNATTPQGFAMLVIALLVVEVFKALIKVVVKDFYKQRKQRQLELKSRPKVKDWPEIPSKD